MGRTQQKSRVSENAGRGDWTQGFGGPCCARILTSWFATNERGTYWGMWNVAHNLGGFLAPILAGTAARTLGWQWGVLPHPPLSRRDN